MAGRAASPCVRLLGPRPSHTHTVADEPSRSNRQAASNALERPGQNGFCFRSQARRRRDHATYHQGERALGDPVRMDIYRPLPSCRRRRFSAQCRPIKERRNRDDASWAGAGKGNRSKRTSWRVVHGRTGDRERATDWKSGQRKSDAKREKRWGRPTCWERAGKIKSISPPRSLCTHSSPAAPSAAGIVVAMCPVDDISPRAPLIRVTLAAPAAWVLGFASSASCPHLGYVQPVL